MNGYELVRSQPSHDETVKEVVDARTNKYGVKYTNLKERLDNSDINGGVFGASISDKIQIKRGLKANLPQLDDGELALCTDTVETFIGVGNKNVKLSNYENVKRLESKLKKYYSLSELDISPTDDVAIKLNKLIESLKSGDTIDCTGIYTVKSTIKINKNITIKNGGFVLADNTKCQMFNITSECKMDSVTVNGNKVNQTGNEHYYYDLITISSTRNVTIQNCRLLSGYGGGISVYNSSDNTIQFNKITNMYDNGILVANKGSDRNKIVGNNISKTDMQNGIFLTAKADSTQTNDYIYDNIIECNIITNIGDTSIESGINCINTLITGNTVDVKNHAGILSRDNLKCNIINNTVKVLSSASDDGISIVPQFKGASLETNNVIKGNRISGGVNRSHVFIGQNDVEVADNVCVYDENQISDDGSNLKGSGVLTDGRSNISIKNNKIKNFANGIYTNYGDFTPTINNLIIEGNKIETTKNSINLYNSVLINSDISNNKLYKMFDNSLKDGNGSYSTRFLNNLISTDGINSRYKHSKLPNQTFISNFSKTGTVPVTQYGTDVVMNNTVGRHGLCYLAFEDKFIYFQLVNTTITPIASNGITHDGTGNEWAISVLGDGDLILQYRGNTTSSKGNYSFTLQ